MRLANIIAAAILWAGTAAAGPPTLTIGVMQGGTVMWELDVITRNGLDAAAGVKIETVPLAGKSATDIAFQGGAVDAIVTDWIWVARQRAEGRDYTFIPYSRAVGGLMAPDDSPLRDLGDLRGATIGVAGGPLDKSWLLLQALARRQNGLDLATETQAVFGAPPLIFQKALSRELDASINFWHFQARLAPHGFRTLISVDAAAQALGLDPQTPLLGYVITGAFARERPEAVAGLIAASRAAKRLLRDSDAEWTRLRPLMNAPDDADYAALIAGYRAGIPSETPVDIDAAARLFAVLAEIGGRDLVGRATTLPDGVFHVATD